MSTYGAVTPPDIIGYLIGPTPAPQVLPVQNGAIVVSDPATVQSAASLATIVGQLQDTIAALTEELILLRAQVFILGQMQNISYDAAYEVGAEINPSGWHADIVGQTVSTPKLISNAQSPYAVLAADMFLAVSAGVSTPTIIDLPAATGSGRVLVIKKIDANAQNVAVTPHGTDDIDGTNAAFNISTQFAAFSFIDYAAGQWGVF